MSIDWNQEALNAIGREAESQVRAQMSPVLARHIAGRFALEEDGRGFAVGVDGVLAEYGDANGGGRSWAIRGLSEL